MHARRLLFVLAIAIVPAARSYAQQAINSATFSGTIQDATGAAIPSAEVTITNLDRNQKSTAPTDERGRFRFSYIPVGPYLLEVRQSGFAPFTANLNVSLGQALDLPITLAVAGVNQDISVTGDIVVVETA